MNWPYAENLPKFVPWLKLPNLKLPPTGENDVRVINNGENDILVLPLQSTVKKY